jgi:crotonobetainyl-CoA:carnitine CoA-transferase CaiB-like acyl-CoA transferase
LQGEYGRKRGAGLVPDEAAVVATAQLCKIPGELVRNAIESMSEAHTLGRGMLRRVEHPSLGTEVLPYSPHRQHWADRVAPMPGLEVGQDNAEVLAVRWGW